MKKSWLGWLQILGGVIVLIDMLFIYPLGHTTLWVSIITLGIVALLSGTSNLTKLKR